MRYSSSILSALLAGALLLSPATRADTNSGLDALFGAHQPYQEFFDSLKSAAARQDWDALSGMVAYPITLPVAARRMTLNSAHALRRYAPQIFTPKVLSAIERQRYDLLFANSSGVMIGAGEIWFSGTCQEKSCANAPVKITAINP